MPLAFDIWLWLVATAGHFVLTVRWSGRLSAGDTVSADERILAVVLGGVGTLSLVLHAVAITAGLGLGSGLAGLAVWHACVAIALRTRREAAGPRRLPSPRLQLIEALAVAWLAGITISWIVMAPDTAVVAGTDAAHYHVPVAVNLALGASPFDLPATQHLYPMAGSMVAAWFIVPTHDALVVDLAMCLPFLLLAASLNGLFRAVTGLTGLGWATWLSAALFATPIFRTSALVSADLWFAASFVATTAVMAEARAAGGWSRRRLVLLALALGLLVGSKTTGALAAALLAAAYLVLALPGVLRSRGWRWPDHWAGRLAAAAGLGVLGVGTGGVWLVRNWIHFGSPLAPTGISLFGFQIFPGEIWQATSYLSVMGDLQRDASYELTARATYFVDRWFGPWFLWVVVPGLVVPFDLALAAWRGRTEAPFRARLLAIALAIGAGVPLIWILVSAPWTSLEWTQGLALRYALPVGALLPWLSLLALFPLAWRWGAYETGPAARALNVAVMAGALFLFRASLSPDAPGHVPVPWLSAQAGLAGLLLGTLAAFPTIRRSHAGAVAALSLCAIAGGFWAVSAARQSDAWKIAGEARRSSDAGAESLVGALYRAALTYEREAGRGCPARRFLGLTRIDAPLDLQPAAYRNLVFYAGRDLASAQRAAPLSPCDYIVTTRALMGTDRGIALMAALTGGLPAQQIADTGRFLLFRGGR